MERFKTFTVLIAKINRSIRRIKNEEMAEFGLKSPHVSCLYYLYKQSGLTAKELSDICDEDKAAISRSLVQLEAEGYIFCASDGKKRYRAPLALTESGRQIAEKIAKKIDGILDFAAEALDKEERESFYLQLSKVSDILQKFCEKYN